MSTSENDQGDVIAFLSSAKTYGITGSVEVHGTHGSLVFLAGSLAYKLKRAVKYPYMNYSTPKLRRHMCERELTVNRRMAPAIYREVKAIVSDGDALRFGSVEDPQAKDWVVVMRRFEQDELLEARRDAGILTFENMIALANVVARFHLDAERVSEFGGIGGIRSVVDESVSMLREMSFDAEMAQQVERFSDLSEYWLARVRGVLGWRRETGYVRRCHGDLHLNNVCMINGEPVLFDAIEFNDSFSCIDVLYDLAFLLMDIDRHELRCHANVLLNRYLERTRDYSGLAALPLFLACRASIRAHVAISTSKVACSGVIDPSVPRNLLAVAITYLRPPAPQLIAVGGLSGTGKSTLARLLAPAVGAAPGAIVLRSDVIRKAMMGVPETHRLDESAYDAQTNAAVYGTICARADVILRAGHSVIVDAVYGRESERGRIEAVAQSVSAKFRGLWLTAQSQVLESRIAQRTGDASDATVPVLRNQISNVSVPSNWCEINAGDSPNEVLKRAEQRVGLGTASVA